MSRFNLLGVAMAFRFRLDRLELVNYHKFDRYTVDFDEHLTVLVGENGSGKSSILDAAAVALGAFFLPFRGASGPKLTDADARLSQGEAGDSIAQEPQFPVELTANGIVGDAGVEDEVSWTRALRAVEDSSPYAGSEDLYAAARSCSERVQAGDRELILPLLAYYGTGRLWSDASSHPSTRRRSFSRVDGYRGALDAKVDADQLIDWFYKMTAQDVQRAQGIVKQDESPLYAAVRSAVTQCFQAISGSERAIVSYDFDLNDLSVEYVDASGDVCRLPLRRMSDGYRTTLGMFADIAYRMALLNPSLGQHVLDTPGVILIDEVDLHLHPLWQARILGDLRTVFPNVQFIVSTHAPVVVSSVRARHVRMLTDGNAAKIPSNEVYGGDVGRIMVSVMNAPERPAEIKARFREFYRVLDNGDLEGAKGLLNALSHDLGEEDTGLVGAQTALALEEADERYAAN